MIAFALFTLTLARCTMSIGSSPPGCDAPFCFAFRAFARPLHSQYILISSLKTPHEVNLARFNYTDFSRSSGNRSFNGTQANVLRKSVCVSLGISSDTVASHEMFHLLNGAHQFRQLCSLKRLRARPTLYGFHISCSLRHLLKPCSPPADMTTSKLSPSVRADSTTKSCQSISADISTPSSSTPTTPIAGVTTSCDSAANAQAPRTFGNTPDTLLSTFLVHTWKFSSLLEKTGGFPKPFGSTRHPSHRCL